MKVTVDPCFVRLWSCLGEASGIGLIIIRYTMRAVTRRAALLKDVAKRIHVLRDLVNDRT